MKATTSWEAMVAKPVTMHAVKVVIDARYRHQAGVAALTSGAPLKT